MPRDEVGTGTTMSWLRPIPEWQRRCGSWCPAVECWWTTVFAFGGSLQSIRTRTRGWHNLGRVMTSYRLQEIFRMQTQDASLAGGYQRVDRFTTGEGDGHWIVAKHTWPSPFTRVQLRAMESLFHTISNVDSNMHFEKTWRLGGHLDPMILWLVDNGWHIWSDLDA